MVIFQIPLKGFGLPSRSLTPQICNFQKNKPLLGRCTAKRDDLGHFSVSFRSLPRVNGNGGRTRGEEKQTNPMGCLRWCLSVRIGADAGVIAAPSTPKKLLPGALGTRELIRDGRCHPQAKRGDADGAERVPRPCVTAGQGLAQPLQPFYSLNTKKHPRQSDVKASTDTSLRHGGTSPSKGAAKGKMSFYQRAMQKTCLQLSRAIK